MEAYSHGDGGVNLTPLYRVMLMPMYLKQLLRAKHVLNYFAVVLPKARFAMKMVSGKATLSYLHW